VLAGENVLDGGDISRRSSRAVEQENGSDAVSAASQQEEEENDRGETRGGGQIAFPTFYIISLKH